MSDGGDSLVLAGLGAAALALAYGFFVLASHAVVRCRNRHLEEHELSGVVGSKLARVILDRADYYVFAAQVGACLSATVFTVLTAVILHRGGLLSLSEVVGGGMLADRMMGGVLALIVLVVLAILYVQLLKAVAYHNPAKTLCYLSIPLAVAARIFDPLVYLLNKVLRKLLEYLGLSMPAGREVAVSPEEISEIVAESSEAGKLEQNEGEMLKGVIRFSDLVVREVMTPRKDIVAVEENASLEDVVRKFTADGFSRMLVVGESLDEVKGVLMAKDLIRWVGKTVSGFTVHSVMREPYSVPNTKRVGELLQEFRRAGIHLAVVQDEHGGVDGLVTIEDLVEEIVGDIFDEYDSPEEEASFRATQAGDLVVNGGALIDELNEAYPFDFPAGEYDTIAGFVINLLGRIPAAGEVVDYNGVKMKIERVVQNRIVRLRILRGAKIAAVSR